jgi:hypothetical protein
LRNKAAGWSGRFSEIQGLAAMRQSDLVKMSSADLVKRFAQIVVAQDVALLGSKRVTFKRLFQQMMDVTSELRVREGDQRRLLMELYNHPNMQVRVQAAKLTLAVAPTAARQQLEAIAETHWMPQAGDAGMSLSNLDRGIFKPT